MPGFNINGIGDGPSAKIETARKNRWRFTALDPVQNILLFAYKSARPQPEIDRITMHQAQDEAHFPGKNRWNPIDVSFYEVVSHPDSFFATSVALAIYQWWGTRIIDLANSKIAEGPIKKRCELVLLDGCDTWVHIYVMDGCWISKVTPDDLDYSDSDILDITFTLQMDKCRETSMLHNALGIL
jgi:hypothetical protein